MENIANAVASDGLEGRSTEIAGPISVARIVTILVPPCPLATQFRSPNMNAYAERFIQTLEHECLDHFIVLGRRHLDYLVEEFLVHYHTDRPHQSKGNLPLIRAGPSLDASESSNGEIECGVRLGGLLRHYSRRAA